MAASHLQFLLSQYPQRCFAAGRVRTGPEKHGKSWNLIIWIPGLESHGILAQVLEVMEFYVGKFVCSRAATVLDCLTCMREKTHKITAICKFIRTL